MNEMLNLLVRARKYLGSAELLLNAGDYESMLVIEPDEAESVLADAKSVVDTIANWLKQNDALPEA